ncbi:hypothetical protein Glove_341g42 [Diversispora epigaea]|uniref:Uncharacterized protein n=1 Tax=Diversispora epigaea TaxID=1348612 RepID=A0A397HLY0_9GLOM|nr:hypothetical protein Glove_341g42 [Diversispora epigaea]
MLMDSTTPLLLTHAKIRARKVESSIPRACQAGLDILKKGGNSADAAIADSNTDTSNTSTSYSSNSQLSIFYVLRCTFCIRAEVSFIPKLDHIASKLTPIPTSIPTTGDAIIKELKQAILALNNEIIKCALRQNGEVKPEVEKKKGETFPHNVISEEIGLGTATLATFYRHQKSSQRTSLDKIEKENKKKITPFWCYGADAEPLADIQPQVPRQAVSGNLTFDEMHPRTWKEQL